MTARSAEDTRTPYHRLRTWLLRILVGLLALAVVAVVGTVIWARTGVHAADDSVWSLAQSSPEMTITETDTGLILSPADGPALDVGLVLLPGAKVEAEAYAGVLSGLVIDEGMTVVVAKPWLNLALLDPRGLDTFTDLAPSIGSWIVGGHSLGGVRACMLAEDADALLLLGSYCSTDLSGTDLPVLSISGSEDGLSTPEKIAENRDMLPADATMVEIEGASHASFGSYGAQQGDGTSTVTLPDMIAGIRDSTMGLVERIDR